MRATLVRLAVVLLALVAGRAAVVLAQTPERIFYYVDREDSYQSFVQNASRISVLAPSAYSVDEEGIVWGDVDPKVLELAKQHGVRVMPLIVNRPFDKDLLHQLLSNPAARARTIASMVELSRRHGYWGMQIDFENVHIDDRDALTSFYREAADALHAAGKIISIAVVHRPDELAGVQQYHAWMMADWRGGYDLKALADAGDFISVMTYSQHTRRTPPGPSAALPWVEDVVDYFLKFMPPEKLSLGIPAGAMHWYTSQEDRITPELARSYSQNLSYSWAQHVAARNAAPLQWHDEYKVSYTFFPVSGTFEYLFVEDARSFAAKLELMRAKKLRGFSVWVLGPEDPRIWDTLR
ncbi:MAG: glycosyl hydrolase family 18 protein [Gemmatimonadota bacterium]